MCLGLVILREPEGSPVHPFLGPSRQVESARPFWQSETTSVATVGNSIGPEMRILPFAAATDSDPCYGPGLCPERE